MYFSERIEALLVSEFVLHDGEGNAVPRDRVVQEYLAIRSYLAARVGVGEVVSINLEYGYRYLLCIYACLQGGYTFVPLRPSWPSQRLDQIGSLVEIKLTLDVELFDSVITSKVKPIVDTSALPADSVAYIIFTSGSSGEPKGVQISREAYANFCQWVGRELPVVPSNRMLFVADFTFDMSLLDVAMMLTSPCQGYFSQFNHDIFRLASELERFKINSIATVPNTIDLLLRKGVGERVDLSNIRALLLGGARFGIETYRKIFKRFADRVSVYNFYGPTEATVYTHVARLVGDEQKETLETNITIGATFPGLLAELRDADGQELDGFGTTGELYLGGAQVMEGYVSKPEVTAEVLSRRGGVKFYKTGDLAFRDARSNYYVVGRTDDTIKRRGFRINLLDIEAYIQQLEGIEDCVLIALEDQHQDHLLVAFVIIDRSLAATAEVPKLLVERMREVLVDYQIPNKVEVVESFPVNNSGKISRQSLRRPALSLLGRAG